MSGVDIGALARPIVELRASLGDAAQVAAAVEALRRLSDELDGMLGSGRAGVDRLADAWRGEAGDAALGTGLRVQTAVAELADRGRAVAEVVERASGQVVAGERELEEILRSFGTSVTALGPAAATPPGIGLIVAAAIDHLGRALAVVGRVRVDLEDETAALLDLAEPIPTPLPVEAEASATAPASTAGPPSAAEQVGGATTPAAVLGPASNSPVGSVAGMFDTASRFADSTRTVPAAMSTPGTGALSEDRTEPSSTGPGVKLTLPDGSTVEAPNQQAADAVRNALGAVGTPYVWGGTTPGVGLDCSGLTQWAYAEAGVPLPRLAQHQGDGHMRVGPGELLPGDLVVWDGHVAMVIGNGQLVEAGDPVQVGPIRTENSGMRFLGFYRPTA
ncbi:C40 family peptidase [Nocardia otitidiscaviarum]|uniref:NlpC/P60 family protein n=1 Tax=Nocardia otitidiscaviarum TaxID=1823 RepID=UPI0004A74285|nr:NlpC/P60 family protein [Nocardia otitidiscaviarum]MBF6133648.1 C40 family peptidase [Nocardia otitidiscaviarum]MBF6487676.1 C40 family peptidase [Nocardia otitidiscaviarum]